MARILLMNLNEDFRQFLINRFIDQGIEVYVSDDIKRSIQTIKTKKITHIIINPDTDFNRDYQFLVKLNKSQPDGHKIYVIVQTSIKEKKTILTLMLSAGVVGIISSIESNHVLFDRLLGILRKTGNYPNKRRAFRIKPDSDEDWLIEFSIKNVSDNISGKIHNISLFGVAFELFNKNFVQELQKGQSIDNVLVSINGRTTPATMEIIRANQVVAAKFIDSNNTQRLNNSLSQFILSKLDASVEPVGLIIDEFPS